MVDTLLDCERRGLTATVRAVRRRRANACLARRNAFIGRDVRDTKFAPPNGSTAGKAEWAHIQKAMQSSAIR
jgi:hypothetical protein